MRPADDVKRQDSEFVGGQTLKSPHPLPTPLRQLLPTASGSLGPSTHTPHRHLAVPPGRRGAQPLTHRVEVDDRARARSGRTAARRAGPRGRSASATSSSALCGLQLRQAVLRDEADLASRDDAVGRAAPREESSRRRRRAASPSTASSVPPRTPVERLPRRARFTGLSR